MIDQKLEILEFIGIAVLVVVCFIALRGINRAEQKHYQALSDETYLTKTVSHEGGIWGPRLDEVYITRNVVEIIDDAEFNSGIIVGSKLEVLTNDLEQGPQYFTDIFTLNCEQHGRTPRSWVSKGVNHFECME